MNIENILMREDSELVIKNGSIIRAINVDMSNEDAKIEGCHIE